MLADSNAEPAGRLLSRFAASAALEIDRSRSSIYRCPTHSSLCWSSLAEASDRCCRWQVGAAVQQRHHGPFPLGTFVVNITGCFLIGLLSTLLNIGWEQRYAGGLTSLRRQPASGGYTTFSSYELDTYLLTKNQVAGRAILAAYWIGSVIAGLAFAWLGHLLGDALGGA